MFNIVVGNDDISLILDYVHVFYMIMMTYVLDVWNIKNIYDLYDRYIYICNVRLGCWCLYACERTMSMRDFIYKLSSSPPEIES